MLSFHSNFEAGYKCFIIIIINKKSRFIIVLVSASSQSDVLKKTQTEIRKRDSSMDHSFNTASTYASSVAGTSQKYCKTRKMNGVSAEVMGLEASKDKLTNSPRTTDIRKPGCSDVCRNSKEDIRKYFAPTSMNYMSSCEESTVVDTKKIAERGEKKNEIVKLLPPEMIDKPQPRRLSRYVNVKKLKSSRI